MEADTANGRAVKHVAIVVNAAQAAKVRAAQARLDDLTSFVAVGANLPHGAKFVTLQGERMVFVVPTEERK